MGSGGGFSEWKPRFLRGVGAYSKPAIAVAACCRERPPSRPSDMSWSPLTTGLDRLPWQGAPPLPSCPLLHHQPPVFSIFLPFVLFCPIARALGNGERHEAPLNLAITSQRRGPVQNRTSGDPALIVLRPHQYGSITGRAWQWNAPGSRHRRPARAT